MAASGTVTINIVGDAAKLRGALGEAETGMQAFSTRMQSIGASMMQFGARMTIGVTAPLVLLGKVAFDAASDLTESMNKVNVVFDDSARDIKQWAQDASSSLLMSRQAALEAAGTLGSVFKASGLGVPEAAKMSKAMVQLAADMGSFNNVGTDEMLIAIRAGLVGEIEPLRKFGVLLNAATVEAKAYEMGLADANGEISEGAKVQARYALILEQTADQQGDIERTAGSAANRQKQLKAEFQDTAAQLGQSLIPIMQTLMGIVQRVAEWFGNLSPQMQQIVVIAAAAAAAIGPLVTVFGALAAIIGFIVSPIGLVVLAIAAIVAAAVLLWLKWDEVWNFIKDHPALAIIIAILAWPVAALVAIVGALKYVYDNWSTIWPQIQSILQGAWSVIEPILNTLKAVYDGINGAIKWLIDNAGSAWDGFVAGVQGMWNLVQWPLQFLLDRLNDILSAARAVKNAVDTVTSLGGPKDQGFFGPVGGLIGLASGGPVMAGEPYIVGEAGPELFVPGTSGQIIPNGGTAGGAGLGGTLTIPLVLDGRVITEVVVSNLNRAGGPQIAQRAVA